MLFYIIQNTVAINLFILRDLLSQKTLKMNSVIDPPILKFHIVAMLVLFMTGN